MSLSELIHENSAPELNEHELQNHRSFERGELDCLLGVPHSSGWGEAYDQGYAKQYEQEQKDAS